ncbi:MAG: FUN14 domain-containing protein [Planctomycetota bacterium]
MATSVDLQPPPSSASAPDPAPKRGMSRATKILIGVAALLLVAGIVLKLVEPPKPEGLTASSAGAASLVDGQGNPIPAADAGPEPWAPGFLKMGFSFFVCFAIGYAARKFLKIGLVFFGMLFAFLFLASYLGYVTVNTEAMSGDWDKFIDNAKTQFDTFKAFLTGSLPAAGLGALGLYAGFRQG